MKKPVLDENALSEEKIRKKSERMLDVHPRPKPDSRKWTVLSVLLILTLMIGFGYIFTRACSLGSRDESDTAAKPAAGPAE